MLCPNNVLLLISFSVYLFIMANYFLVILCKLPKHMIDIMLFLKGCLKNGDVVFLIPFYSIVSYVSDRCVGFVF